MIPELTERRWRPLPTEHACRGDRVVPLSDSDRCLYMLLFLACDDGGVFVRAERHLRNRVGWFTKSLPSALRRIADAKLVVLYKDGGVEYGCIVDYRKLVALSWQPHLTYPGPPPELLLGLDGGGVRSPPTVTPHRGTQPSTPTVPPDGPPPPSPQTVSDTVGGDGVGHGGGTPSPHTVGVDGGVSPPPRPRPLSPHTPLSPTPTPPAPGEGGESARHLPALEARALDAIRLWLRHLASVAPTHCIADDVVASVARDFTAEVFAAGVEAHIGDEAQWWRRAPLKSLRKRCEWAATRPPASAPWPARASAPAPTPTPTGPERDSRVVKVDGRKLRAFVAGTAPKDVVAEVMAAPMRVQLAGESRAVEKPFGEWPPDEREKAIAFLREPQGAHA